MDRVEFAASRLSKANGQARGETRSRRSAAEVNEEAEEAAGKGPEGGGELDATATTSSSNNRGVVSEESASILGRGHKGSAKAKARDRAADNNGLRSSLSYYYSKIFRQYSSSRSESLASASCATTSSDRNKSSSRELEFPSAAREGGGRQVASARSGGHSQFASDIEGSNELFSYSTRSNASTSIKLQLDSDNNNNKHSSGEFGGLKEAKGKGIASGGREFRASEATDQPLISSAASSKLKRKGFLYLKSWQSSGRQTGSSQQQKEVNQVDGNNNTTRSKSTKRRDMSSANFVLTNLLLQTNQSHSINRRNQRDDRDDGQGACLLSGSGEDLEEFGNKMVDNNNNNLIAVEESREKRSGSGSGDSLRRASPPVIVALSCLLLLGAGLVRLAGAVPQSGGPQVGGDRASGFGNPQRSQQQQPAPAQLPGGGLAPPTGGAARAGGPQPAAGSLVASINCNKIRGHVTMTPNLQGGGTTVSTQISAGPAGEVYQWGVHQFPVKPGAAMCSCSPMILGSKLIDLSEMHGNLPSDQEFSVQSSINLFGSDSPVGHSLMLRGMKTGMVACATFLPTSRKSNYRAKFHTPISGSVTIFQTAFGTSFISHLMHSNGTRRHSMHRFDIVKTEDDMVTTSLLGSSSSAASSARSLQQESQLLELKEHEHELSQCRRHAQGEPLFRNISHQLAVSTENFGMRGRTALVLPQIPFETFSSVFVVLYSEADPSEPVACAPLKFVRPKTAAAKFATGNVQGSAVFSQDSPYDVTLARINLQLPNSDGHSYGIDELPMIIRRKSDTRVCPNIREIIYNPHHIEPSSVPAEGEATSDQYAVGDLSGKYGSLTGKASEQIQVQDFNLPLFGPLSVVGRAMTIYSAEGVAIACSNVELTGPMTTAFATFDHGIQGQFIFRQPVNDCNGDTYVYIEVSKPVVGANTNGQSTGDNQQTRSIDHNWHIHANPVDSGLEHLSTTDCAPAGPHYNPYNTSTSSIYSRDCTPFNVLRCELGDLSAKMFTLEIPPYRVRGSQEPEIGKFFGTDIDLPLCGPVSIVNRSVVVHAQDFGHQRLACSTVIEFKPRTR